MVGIIRFFGYLAQSRPAEVTQQYPIFLQTVFSFLTASDPALKLIAIQTIGAVANSEQGLRVVFDNKARNDEIMKMLCNNINSSEADVKARSLEALALVFHSADIPSEDLSVLTRSLFSAMPSNPLQILMDVSKQPFQDVRCAVLKVFRSLAKYKWAQEGMTTCPGKKTRTACISSRTGSSQSGPTSTLQEKSCSILKKSKRKINGDSAHRVPCLENFTRILYLL